MSGRLGETILDGDEILQGGADNRGIRDREVLVDSFSHGDFWASDALRAAADRFDVRTIDADASSDTLTDLFGDLTRQEGRHPLRKDGPNPSGNGLPRGPHGQQREDVRRSQRWLGSEAQIDVLGSARGHDTDLVAAFLGLCRDIDKRLSPARIQEIDAPRDSRESTPSYIGSALVDVRTPEHNRPLGRATYVEVCRQLQLRQPIFHAQQLACGDVETRISNCRLSSPIDGASRVHSAPVRESPPP